MTAPYQEERHPEDRHLNSEQLAALTGFDDPDNRPPRIGSGTIDPDTGTSEIDDEEIEAEMSRHSFATHPITKLVVVALGVLGLVTIGGLFIYAITGGGLWAKKHAPPPQKFTQQVPEGRKADSEKAALLTELALKDQKDALRNLGKTKPKSKPVPKPQRVVRAVAPPPERIPPRVYAPPPQPRLVHPVKPAPMPSPSPVDPYQQWLAQSQLGSYGSIKPPTEPSNGASQEPSRAPNAILTGATAPANEAEPHPVSITDILVGTRAKVKIQSAIAFTDSTQATDNRYVGELLEPLRNASGQIAFPQGAKIVFQLLPSEAPLVTLNPVALVAESNKQLFEYPIPTGALAVVSSGDKPLIAKEKRVNRGNNQNGLNIALGALGEVGRAMNIPEGEIPERVYRRSARQQYYGYTRATRVYTVPAGSTVEVIAVESFSPFSQNSQNPPAGQGQPSAPLLPQRTVPLIPGQAPPSLPPRYMFPTKP